MKRNHLILIVFLIVLVATLFSIFKVNKFILNNQKEELLTQAKQASLFVSHLDIVSFERNQKDLEKQNYQNILDKLINFREANSKIRFLYILGYDETLGKQFFYLDTESPSSKDYSSPGSIFEDTRPIDIENFKKGEDYIDGPYQDSWGTWYSAYSPIKNNQGETVALTGVDVSSSLWRTQIIFSTTIISLIALLIFGILIYFIFSIYRKQSSIESLEKETNFLSNKEKKFKDFQKIVKVGEFNFFFGDKMITLDEYLSSVLKVNNNIKISLDDFVELISPEDRIKFTELINKVELKEIEKFDLVLNFLNKENNYIKYNLIAKIKDPNSAKLVIGGILKDLS